jgi:hypothetical protein
MLAFSLAQLCETTAASRGALLVPIFLQERIRNGS